MDICIYCEAEVTEVYTRPVICENCLDDIEDEDENE